MSVDREWVKRNTGFDPLSVPLADPRRQAMSATIATTRQRHSPDDMQREIIDFDSEGPAGAALFAISKATGLSSFTDINWPSGLAPQPKAPISTTGGKLPKAEVLVVTWTVDEGHALSRVLTPGKDSRNDYKPYKRNFAKLARMMSKGSSAVKAGRLGAYWTTSIGGKKADIFKSESHLSQDTDKHYPPHGVLPNALFWKQIIDDVKPRLVITTGTGGGIGRSMMLIQQERAGVDIKVDRSSIDRVLARDSPTTGSKPT